MSDEMFADSFKFEYQKDFAASEKENNFSRHEIKFPQSGYSCTFLIFENLSHNKMKKKNVL